jgi:tetratricopeptide (TPR) repeat protein
LPNHPELRLILAETYLSRGDVRKAGPHLKLAASAAPNDRQYLNFFYSRYWTAMGDFSAARKYASEAYAADPGRSLYQKELGIASFRVNDLEATVQHLGDALTGGDTDPMVFLYLGEALFQTRKWEAAEVVWTRGSQRHAKSFPLHLRLVEFLDQTARPEEAAKIVRAYEARMGRVPEAGILRIHHERLTGYPNLALRLLRKWKMRTRGALAVELRWEEAQLLFETGQYVDSHRAADRLIRENCHVAEAYFLKAKVARFQHKPEEAETFVRLGKEANPFGRAESGMRSFSLSAAAQHPELLAAIRP